MSLRLQIGLFLAFLSLLFIVFAAIALHALWGYIGYSFPAVLETAIGPVPMSAILVVCAGAMIVALGFVLLLIYVFLNRIFIQPVQILSSALHSFALESVLDPLPDFPRSSKEIHALTNSFLELADSVQKVHERDMEISRVKSDFISTAAHQLRTPLTGIRWALEALERDTLTEEQHALVKNATDKSHDLVAIVGTLLDISSIESGKYKYTFVAASIEPVLARLVQDFQTLAAASTITLAYIPSPSPLPQVRIDADRIKWVLNNLIENAIRYTPAGGTVQVGLEAAPERILVHVRDTGIGISTEDRANIFERFYRAGNAIAKENQGNGLGLYIARTIATDHGGDLNFTANDSGVGTTFTLSLPIAT